MGCHRTVVVALAVFTLAGCGEDREGSVEQSGAGTDTSGSTGTSTSPAASGGAPVATVKVKETEYTLFPENPEIDKVGLVKFEIENAGTLTHALEIEGPNGEVETKGIKAGKSATLEAELSKPGTYKWYCPINDHEGRGMNGKITVAGGSGAAPHKTAGDGSGGHPGKRQDDSGKDDSGKDGTRKDDSSSGPPRKRESGTAGGVH